MGSLAVARGHGNAPGEALALGWRHPDATACQVAIRRSAVLVKHHGEGETIEVGPPKSGRARVSTSTSASSRRLGRTARSWPS